MRERNKELDCVYLVHVSSSYSIFCWQIGGLLIIPTNVRKQNASVLHIGNARDLFSGNVYLEESAGIQFIYKRLFLSLR